MTRNQEPNLPTTSEVGPGGVLMWSPALFRACPRKNTWPITGRRQRSRARAVDTGERATGLSKSRANKGAKKSAVKKARPKKSPCKATPRGPVALAVAGDSFESYLSTFSDFFALSPHCSVQYERSGSWCFASTSRRLNASTSRETWKSST